MFPLKREGAVYICDLWWLVATIKEDKNSLLLIYAWLKQKEIRKLSQ